MAHYNKFIADFMAHYAYPDEATALFTEVLKKLDENPDFAEPFDALTRRYSDHRCRIDDILPDLKVLAEKMGYSEYTLNFVFLLSLTEELYEMHHLMGLGDTVYYATMGDLRYKLLECMECEHVPGTFVAGWFDGFFRMERFAYGRFQFEICHVDLDGKESYTMKSGRVVHPGDKYVNMHIPSSGQPLTDEVRFASYKEAYKHVKGLFPDGKVLFGCGSWLLFPKHKEFLPPELNILKFFGDFEIVRGGERDHFGDDWRVFGHYTELPLEEWPEDTKLRKAYHQWLMAGNKTGSGFGLFEFDGEKILK